MRLKVVGQGVKNLSHITLEALESLKQAKKVLYISIDSKATKSWLLKYNINNIECIKELYELRAKDEDNYKKILDKIYNDLKKYQDIVVLVPGHPRIGVTLLQWLEKDKDKFKFNLEVTPGISSFASMINDLKIDPLERGAQIIDANRALLFKYDISPQLDTFIYHVCSVGTNKVHYDNASAENHILWLKNYLLKFYPNEHVVQLICSNINENNYAPSIHKINLSMLEKLLDKIHFGTTLFVPAIRNTNYDKNYLKLLIGKYRNTERTSHAI